MNKATCHLAWNSGIQVIFHHASVNWPHLLHIKTTKINSIKWAWLGLTSLLPHLMIINYPWIDKITYNASSPMDIIMYHHSRTDGYRMMLNKCSLHIDRCPRTTSKPRWTTDIFQKFLTVFTCSGLFRQRLRVGCQEELGCVYLTRSAHSALYGIIHELPKGWNLVHQSVISC